MPRRLALAAATALLLVLAPVAGAREVTTHNALNLPLGVGILPDDTAWFTTPAPGGAIARLQGGAFTASAATIPGVSTYAAVGEPNGSRIFLAGDDTITAILAGTGQVATTYPLGAGVLPYDIAISRDGTRLWVPDRSGNRAIAVDVATGGLEEVPVGSNPEGIAIHPLNGRVYVTNRNSDTVSVIDPAVPQVIATIPGITTPQGIAISPDGTRAYVASDNGGITADEIVAIDTATNIVAGRASLGVGNVPRYLVVSPDGSRVYVTEEGLDFVAILDTEPFQVNSRVLLDRGSGPWGIARNAEGTRLYVSLPGSTQVAQIQLTPRAPSALAESSVTSSTAVIGFTAPGDNGEPIRGYEYSLDGGAWQTTSPATTASPITITGLDSGTRYAIRLRAVNDQGKGEASAPITIATKPSNAFTLGRTTAKVERRRIVLTTRVTVPGPGAIRQVATTRKGRKSTRRCRTSATATASGTVTLTCTIGRAGRNALRTARMNLRVATTYAPAGIDKKTTTRTVKLKRRR